LNRAGTFLIVSLLWAFFVWSDGLTAMKMLLSVFTTFNYGAFFIQLGNLGLTLGDWIVLAAATGLLGFVDVYKKPIVGRYTGLSPAARTAVLCTLALLILVFGMYGIGFDAEAFIYSRF